LGATFAVAVVTAVTVVVPGTNSRVMLGGRASAKNVSGRA